MSKKRVKFIVNPISGYSNKQDLRSLIKQNLDQDKFSYNYVETQHKGHAIELSSVAVKEKYDIVVACGGDGTVNEVAQSLVNTNVSLGIIPKGSGNGFAMYIGMGRNIKKAIIKLNSSTTELIDSCTVNDQFFLNLAGVGFDALIAYKADSGEKRGFQMYLMMILKEMFRFRAQQFKVYIDNELIESDFTTIAVANAPMYGYNFSIAPLADLRDGLLDTVFVKKASLIRMIVSSWRMLNNSIDKSALVSIKKSKEVTISTDKPYYFHLDGESFVFEKPLHFKIHPRSMLVQFPKSK